jgi:hypothetical protein
VVIGRGRRGGLRSVEERLDDLLIETRALHARAAANPAAFAAEMRTPEGQAALAVLREGCRRLERACGAGEVQ